MTRDIVRVRLLQAAWGLPVALLVVFAAVAAGRHRTTDVLPYYVDDTFAPHWLKQKKAAAVPVVGGFSLTNQEGREVTNLDVDGRVRVVNFFYTHCGDICPMTRERLRTIATKYAGDDRVVILSHSVAPHVDTPAALGDFATAKAIRAPAWQLLTGADSTLDRLARDAYHLKAPSVARSWGVDSIAHTERVVLVDQAGHLRGVYNGTLPLEMEHLAADIETLLRSPAQ